MLKAFRVGFGQIRSLSAFKKTIYAQHQILASASPALDFEGSGPVALTDMRSSVSQYRAVLPPHYCQHIPVHEHR